MTNINPTSQPPCHLILPRSDLANMVVTTPVAVRRHARPQGRAVSAAGGLLLGASGGCGRRDSSTQPTLTQQVNSRGKNDSTTSLRHLTARPPSRWQRMGHLWPLQPDLPSLRWVQPLGRGTAPAAETGWTLPQRAVGREVLPGPPPPSARRRLRQKEPEGRQPPLPLH